MAIGYPKTWSDPNDVWNSTIANNYVDHAIQGKMLTVRYSMADFEFNSTLQDPDSIKRILLQQLVNEIFDQKCVEFTKMQNPIDFRHQFAARIFVVPDTMVRILREKKVV